MLKTRSGEVIGDRAPPLKKFGEIISMPVARFLRVSGISRRRLYDLINENALESFLLGSRRFIIISSYEALIKRAQEAEGPLRAFGPHAPAAEQQPPEPPQRRGPGRPRKSLVPIPAAGAPRRRGRPRKHPEGMSGEPPPA